MNTKIIIAVLAALAVVGVASWFVFYREQDVVAENDAVSHTFVSETEGSMTVSFDNEAATATMTGAGYSDITFTQAISASGARYVNEELDLVLWNKGNEVTLYKGEEPVFVGTTKAASSDVEEVEEEEGDNTPVVPSTPDHTRPVSLEGSSWSWVRTDLHDGTRVEAPAGDKFILSFDGSGRVSSRTDCNGLGGNYVVDGEVLSMGQFISTLMYCEGSLEGVYGEQLGLVNSYVIEGGTLRLNLNRDHGTMIFKRHQ